MSETKTANRLIHETSPYLLHHAHNPVDWHPWGDEAFAKAKSENKPLLLSCGYQACHWCHVMERESFEDEATAAMMNEFFVSVKVDREERPDIDHVYQSAVQIMTGQGGWPLTVFLTPDGTPFFGGTYYPPTPSYGRPSFQQVLTSIREAWQNKPSELHEYSQRIVEALSIAKVDQQTIEEDHAFEELIQGAIRDMVNFTDSKNGGFGRAPKFPMTGNLLLMLRHGQLTKEWESLESALFTLRQMARGGIHDQLGGGFHRYSTDQRWLVPHFEKMLYDNAQLLEAYCSAYQLTHEEEFAEAAHGIVSYLHREMTDAEGGFYATQDADSEGIEGKFYVWSFEEIRQSLPESTMFEAFCRYYGATSTGNFEGENILHRVESLDQIAKDMNMTTYHIHSLVTAAEDILFEDRERRIRPFRDEKIILGWNGLMISGLARAYQALNIEETLKMAQRAASFALETMKIDTAHLYRIHKDGQAKIPAFLDDYAFFTAGLIDLFESDFNPHWLMSAQNLIQTVLSEFKMENGHYSMSGSNGECLFTQPVSGEDQAIPSGVAIHTQNLIRLAALTNRDDLRMEANGLLQAYQSEVSSHPFSYAALVTAAEMLEHPPVEIVLVGLENDPEGLLRQLNAKFIPYRVVAGLPASIRDVTDHPAKGLLTEKEPIQGRATAYICSGMTCHPPKTRWDEMEPLFC